MTIEIECDRCGKYFERAKSLVNDGENYCNKKCWKNNLENNKKEVSCSNCDSNFEVYPKRYEKRQNFFCSKDCEAEYWAENNTGQDNPNYERIKTNCDYCGTEIQIINWDEDNYDYHFCNNDCRQKSNIHRPKGKEHHGWKDEVIHYPGEFYQIRDTIIERDNEECKRCGFTREEHLEKYGRDIFVHHIDGDKNNNEKDNLITLCHKCNSQVEYMDSRPNKEEILNYKTRQKL